MARLIATSPGRYGQTHRYESQSSLDFIASRGLDTVRIAFRWERLQPRLNAPLDRTELTELEGVVERASRAGLKVILDAHNYGAYYLSDGSRGVRRAIGTRELPLSAFADLWSRIASTFKDSHAVVGYGLMNEPVNMPSRQGLSAERLWEEASQRAVDAVRAVDRRTTILVAGYDYGGVAYWPTRHPAKWISDPVDRSRYEAHHYFDIAHSGRYEQSFQKDLALSRTGARVRSGHP